MKRGSICFQPQVSPDTALRLSRYFGTSAEFWNGLQQEFDFRKDRAESGVEIESQVMPLAVQTLQSIDQWLHNRGEPAGHSPVRGLPVLRHHLKVELQTLDIRDQGYVVPALAGLFGRYAICRH